MISNAEKQWLQDLNHLSPVIYGLDRNSVTCWEKKPKSRGGPDTRLTGDVMNIFEEMVAPLLGVHYYDVDIYNIIENHPGIRRPDGQKYTEWTIKLHIRKLREKLGIFPPKPESKNTLAVIDMLGKGKTREEIMQELGITVRYYQLITQLARKKGLL